MKFRKFKIPELTGIETQVVFKSSLEVINKAFNYQYSKTWIDGLGEQYHFIAYASDDKVFVIGTYVNVDNLGDKVVNWEILSHDLSTASLVLENFKISDNDIVWRKEE